jgi:hypothetical protein
LISCRRARSSNGSAAGGYGLGGVLTPTGVGTAVEEGKHKVEVNGRTYLVEVALGADFALVQAFLADYLGNLAYALTARNFNPIVAMAGATVIASAEHIVPVGVISPRSCHHAGHAHRPGVRCRHARQPRDRPSDPGGRPVTALPGASTFDSAMSFGLICGGHVDVTVLAGLQLDQAGRLAD